MEAKKASKADLSSKSGLFLGIGVTVALSMVISAFEWRSYNDPLVDLRAKVVNDYEALIDIPQTDILPPPPPVILFNPVEARDNEVVAPIPVIDILDPIPGPVEPLIVIVAPPAEETDEPLVFPEQSASPIGGFEAFYKYVGENTRYPSMARRQEIEGRVFVEFVIAKNGALTEVKVVKGIGGGCDEEAARIVKSAPAWNPGKQRGKPVRQRYTLPIIFKLR